ncbi:patatin [Vibrio cholerae]|nr:patatin [Vibrio cholerae]
MQTDHAVRILTLNGGGVRGLFTISVLAELERILEETNGEKDVKIGDYFDLIAGTSIGGILALGLAKGCSARELKETFFKSAPLIFPRYIFFDRLIKTIKKAIGPSYNSQPLREAIVKMIGEDTTFNDLQRRVIIPAVNLSTGRPQFFKTPHNPDFYRDGNILLLDAALATSAAPTYFSPHYCKEFKAYFADGGLVANDPSFVALHEVFGDMKLDFPSITHSDIHILNVGTMANEYSIRPQVLASKNQGYFGLWGNGEKLVLTTMTSNQLLHQNMLTRELKANNSFHNYISIDDQVPNEAAQDITLDNSSSASLDNLASRGKHKADEVYAKNQKLKQIFSIKAKTFQRI